MKKRSTVLRRAHVEPRNDHCCTVTVSSLYTMNLKDHYVSEELEPYLNPKLLLTKG